MENTIKNLAEIVAINDRINTVDIDAIKALHKFIFGEQMEAGDYESRQQLKNFEGLSFKRNTPEYRKKLQDAQQLTIGDFINCCDILGLEIEIILLPMNIIYNNVIHIKTLFPIIFDCKNYVGIVVQIKRKIFNKLLKTSDDVTKSLQKLIFGKEGDSFDRKWNIAHLVYREISLREYEQFIQQIGKRFTINKFTIYDKFINCCQFFNLSINEINKLIILMCNGLVDINMLAAVPNNQHDTEKIKKNIKVSIQHFNGEDAYFVKRWITDIEEVSTLLKLTEEQKVMLAKMLLMGLAKIWIKNRYNIKTWENLKTALKELSNEIYNSQLHKNLAKRKMEKKENVQDYYIAMQKLAQDKIKPETLIQYVINGIPDNTNNKAILYGAKDLDDFLRKLKLYKTIDKEEFEKMRCQKEE